MSAGLTWAVYLIAIFGVWLLIGSAVTVLLGVILTAIRCRRQPPPLGSITPRRWWRDEDSPNE